MFDRAVICRAAPFFAYILFVALADGLVRSGFTEMDLRWLYATKIAVVLALLLFWRRDYAELARPEATGLFSCGGRTWLVAVVVGIAVYAAWINLGADWMRAGRSVSYQPLGPDGQIDWLLIAVRLAGAALVVPVMEELFWRSFLLRWLTRPDFRRVNPATIAFKAFVITAGFFAFEHNLWLAGLVAGVAYNLLYIRSRTLWSPILAHGVTNGVFGIWIIYTGHWEYW